MSFFGGKFCKNIFMLLFRYRPCGSKEYVSDSYSFVSGSKVKEPLQGESVTTSQNRTTVVLKEEIPANERTKKFTGILS